MFNKLSKAVHNLYHGKKGITGLETAIILIAFVTVAAVLAYTVLSAGIFSSERGKEAVYGGLEGAQSTMEVKGSTVASSDGTNLQGITFTLALAIPGSQVDMSSIVINYFDKNEVVMGLALSDSTDLAAWESRVPGATHQWFYSLSSGSTERGSASMLEGDEQMVIYVDITESTATAPAAYDQFTVQVVPPAGATLTVQKTLPGGLTSVFSLN
jgi:flagellin FlaB